MQNEFQKLSEEFVNGIREILKKEVMRRVLEEIGEAKWPTAGKKRGPPKGRPMEARPCPVCSAPNKNRRFRYYCSEHKAQSGTKV